MELRSRNDNTFHSILPVLVVAVLTGCVTLGGTSAPTATLEASFLDSSIITGIPCRAPCWYGLELGRSTKAEILATAQSLPFIDPKEFPERPAYYWDPLSKRNVAGTLVHLNCRKPVGATCVGMLLVNDVLKQIYLLGYPRITLSEVVNHLGAPEYVKVYPVETNVMLCNVALIWKQRGIWVAFLNGTYNSPPQEYQVRCQDVRGGEGVSPSLPVGQVNYELPDDFARVPEPGADFPWSGFAKP